MLLIYAIFLISYSIYISEYKQLPGSMRSYSGIISLLFLILNSLLELVQFIYSIYQIKEDSIKNLYLFSKKNIIECLTYIIGIVTIVLDYSQTNLVLTTIAILFSYAVLIIKMDKFYIFGKYIRVIGKIIKKASGLFFIVCLLLIAFCLSFKNLEKNFSTNQEDQLSNFNSSFELGLFKTFTMMIGSLETENMGINEMNSFSFINFIVYGVFIYFMSILLLNIFTGISIDQVSELFKTAERDDCLNKIDFILKIEKFKKIKIIGLFLKKIDFSLIVFDKIIREVINYFKENFYKCIANGKSQKNYTVKQNLTSEEIEKKSGKREDENENESKILDELAKLNVKVQRIYEKALGQEKKKNDLEDNLNKLRKKIKKIKNLISNKIN